LYFTLAFNVGHVNRPLVPFESFANLLLLSRDRGDALLVICDRAQGLPEHSSRIRQGYNRMHDRLAANYLISRTFSIHPRQDVRIGVEEVG
jgi:hypothetical protein